MRYEFCAMSTEGEFQWFQQSTRVIRCEDSLGLMAYREPFQPPVAGAVFDSFSVDSCNVHLAVLDPWVLRHGFLTLIADYAYDYLNRARMFGLVPENNQKALKLNTHIGFKRIAHIPDAVDTGVGYVVMRLDREDCRWRSQAIARRPDNAKCA